MTAEDERHLRALGYVSGTTRDAERRAALQETETLQAEANQANRAISEKKKAGEDATEAIAAMK